MTHSTVRNTLVGLELIVAIMAVYGSVSLLLDAEGFGVKIAWLHGSPFMDYQIPALALLLGVGGSSILAAAAVLHGRAETGMLLSVGAGLVLIGFEIAEAYWFGLRNFQQPLMFAIGTVIVGLGAIQLHRNPVRPMLRIHAR